MRQQFLRSGATFAREAPLRAWAQQWGFTAPERPSGPDWLLTVARRTAAHLRGDPNWRKAWVFVGSFRDSQVESLSPWEPLHESESDFRKRVEAYIVAVRSAAVTQGLVPTGQSRAPEQQFRRLALFQVKGLSHKEIADLEDNERSDGEYMDAATIRKAVCDVAALVGLTLRTPTRGRPTEKTTHKTKS